ncbi:MAG: Stp1/IreP family PP2C-type Ser/Thr phosphatase [Solirubrobacterales bacterium]|jgi:serine/threonine protein phosphatase PrpC|nr:Stp1/IreP family PP2C-type Ser/Thr phosphatase [Solirubrobacterales bacterium]
MLRVAEHSERSDTGRQRRGNEDAFFARAPLFAVADGMGGAQAGEVASGLAVEVLEQGLPDSGGSVEERLAARVREANARINELARSDDQRAGMGTTLTAAYVGEDDLSVAHVGDSRLYRLRDGSFERLTEDHSLVEELVRQGKLTPEEADEHPQRSIITRALGPEAEVEADTRTWPARDGDLYLICSDGLTSMVAEGRIAEIIEGTIRDGGSLAASGRALIEAANAAGGRDNITVVLFRLEDVGGPAVATPTARHQKTSAGATAPHTEDVRRAVAEAESARVERRLPRAPEPAPATRARRRFRPRIPAGLVVGLFIVAAVLLGGYYASQTVYFLGTDANGFVTVYRGVPYDLPAGLSLYTRTYESGVPVGELTPGQRTMLASHKLRSHNDAQDLVRQLETGALVAS